MSDSPRICISSRGVPPMASILRSETVSAVFWARLRSELDSFGRSSDDEFKAPLATLISHRNVIARLCREFGVGVKVDQATTKILQRANDEVRMVDQAIAQAALPKPMESPNRLVRPLKEFQHRDASKLLELGHGANFSVPGSGKTLVTLVLFEAEREAGRVQQMLVVCPMSAFEAWEVEAAESFEPTIHVSVFDPTEVIRASTEVLLVNYAKLPGHLDTLAEWVLSRPTHVVLDEAHRIKKGRAGAWGRACLELAPHAERRDVLTGTPAPQHPADLATLIDFAWPDQSRRILPSSAFVANPSPSVGEEVAAAARPLFARTRKSELGLSEPTFEVLALELHGLHRDIYTALVDEYRGKLQISRRDRLDFARMRQVVMYLLEAATNPTLLPVGSADHDPPAFQHPPLDISDSSDLGQLLREYGRYETPAKFRKVGEIIRANGDRGVKTLIWSYFVRNLETLRRDLARYQPAMIHGGIPMRATPSTSVTREMEVERFREDPECLVLLANPAAMGEGVSLHQTCNHAVYLERTFNAGQYLQSVDRIHRLGLAPEAETRITFLVTQETIDEVVAGRVQEKAARLGEMLDDPDIRTMALPDEDDLQLVDSGFGQPIDSAEDVAALFRHLRGDGHGTTRDDNSPV